MVFRTCGMWKGKMITHLLKRCRQIAIFSSDRQYMTHMVLTCFPSQRVKTKTTTVDWDLQRLHLSRP
eukprot:2016769-Amphidinium_carterae.1